jgi:hypothetical protein
MTRRLRLACTLALLVPVCGATGSMLLVALGEHAGAAPFGGLAPQNSAEAAGWGRADDLLRFLRSGEDPRQVYAVRPEIISSAVRRATTLEASMWSRQLELVRLLDQIAAFDEEERASLACLAADLKVDDVVEYLAPDGLGHCESGTALERVVARSRSS